MVVEKTIHNFIFFLNFDFTAGSTVQIFDFTNDLILNDSCPLKISTANLPFLVVLILLLTNLVKFAFFLQNYFLKMPLLVFIFNSQYSLNVWINKKSKTRSR